MRKPTSALILGNSKQSKLNVLIILTIIGTVTLAVGIYEVTRAVNQGGHGPFGFIIGVVAIFIWLFTSVLFFINLGSYLVYSPDDKGNPIE